MADFFDGGAIGDTIRFAVVDESFFGLELVEAMEDGGRMADDEKFVFERSIDASNGGRDGELSVDKFDAGDGSFKLIAGIFEDGITGGVGKRGWLKTDEDINRKHNHEERSREDFYKTFWPAKGFR